MVTTDNPAHASAAPRPARRPRRPGKAAIALGALLMLLLLAGALQGILGDHKTGLAPAVEDVPTLGPLLAPLSSAGPVRYVTWQGRGGYRCAIGGQASAEALQRFAEHWNLSVQPIDTDFDQAEHIADLGGDPDHFPTRFGPGGWLASGYLRNIGHACLLYGPQGGAFLLTIEGDRPLRRVGQSDRR